MPVFRLKANDPEEACRQSLQRVSVLVNQYLSAEPADEVDAHENNLNLRAEALEHPLEL